MSQVDSETRRRLDCDRVAVEVEALGARLREARAKFQASKAPVGATFSCGAAQDAAAVQEALYMVQFTSVQNQVIN